MNKPAVKLGFNEPGFKPSSSTQPPSNAPRFEELWGTIRRVSAAPTWTPRGKIEDSLALYNSSGTRRLYIYDYSTESWHYASLT